MNDLRVEDISNMIVESVLSETYLNKENLKAKIYSILKIWVKKQNNFKPRRTADTNKLLWTIQKEKLETQFWHKKMKQLVFESKIQEMYSELDNLLKQEGLDKFNSDGN